MEVHFENWYFKLLSFLFFFIGILFFCILPTSRHARCTAIVIENGAECNNTSNDGMPLLVVACLEAKENEDICKKLLDQGADPNSTHPVSFPIPQELL